MVLQPLIVAGPLILIHTVAALLAIGLGVVQFALPKGSGHHRVLGWAWIGTMTVVAMTSFGIHEIRQFGRFSWIHGLSIVVLALLVVGVVLARRGRIVDHRWTMTGLFVGALIISGLFTLVPGRVMHRVLFGS